MNSDRFLRRVHGISSCGTSMRTFYRNARSLALAQSDGCLSLSQIVTLHLHTSPPK
jgi:hypothetical protein